jgi:hypothetical protein
MGKKTEREEDRIFKPPESPHFQTAADRPARDRRGARFVGAANALENRHGRAGELCVSSPG